MGKISTITKKNFKLVLRSKASAIIMMLGPVLLMFVIGLALNNTATSERIDIGYISPEENNLTQEFISTIQMDQYSIEELQNMDECREKIGAGKLHICIVFPKNFEITNKRVNEIDFIVDNSKVNLFRSVVDSMENKFNKKAQELTTGMTKELLQKLNQTTEEITNQSDIITKLKDENEEIRENLEGTEDNINSMNLQFNTKDLNLEELEEFSSVIHDLETHTEDAIDETEDLIGEIEDFMEEANLTVEEENSLTDLINDSQTNIDQIRDELNDTKTDSNNKFQQLIDNLKDNVENLDNRLSSANAEKSESLRKIDELKEQSLSSLSKINQVEATFKAITSNINSTQVTDVQSIVNPIVKNIEPLVAHQSQLNFYFPYLIIMVIMFVGILLASNLVYMEKSSKAYFRNFVTPTNDVAFLISTYLTTMIMITIQLIFVMLVFTFYFNKNLMANLPVTVFILFVASSIFTLLGILIGNVFNSNESNMLASISVSSIMLFVSDLVYPLEKMPQTVADLAMTYNPFYVTSDLLRKSTIHNVAMHDLQEGLTVVALTLLILVFLGWATHKLMKELFILQFSGYIGRRNMRKTAQKEDFLKVYKNIKSLQESNAFITNDNKKIKDLDELGKFVAKLKTDEFREYVNNERNAFAEWVSRKLGDENLTSDLYNTKSKRKTANLLRQAHGKFKKLDKKMQKKNNR